MGFVWASAKERLVVVQEMIPASLLSSSSPSLASRNLLAPSQQSSCVCGALNPYSINSEILFKASLFEALIHLTALPSALVVAASPGQRRTSHLSTATIADPSGETTSHMHVVKGASVAGSSTTSPLSRTVRGVPLLLLCVLY